MYDELHKRSYLPPGRNTFLGQPASLDEEFENPIKIGFLGVLANQKTAGTPDSRRRPSGSRLVAGGCPAACRHSAGGTSPRSTLSNVHSGCSRRWLRCCATTTKPGKKRAGRPTTSGPGKRAWKAGNFGPRDPHHHPQQVPDADLRQVLHTLAESVQSFGARMDAVETPGRIPGRVQAHNPPSFIATAPFSFQQPSGSAPSAFTGYAPGTCSGTTVTAAPAVAPFAYSLATALPVQLQDNTATTLLKSHHWNQGAV
ncbi:unnamed protein product [Boreogadus saida]